MYKFDAAVIQSLEKLLQIKQRLVILVHKNPDGDAIGSSTGFSRFLLEEYGLDVPIIAPDEAPDYLYLGETHHVHIHMQEPKLCEDLLTHADLIFCMDFNRLDRLNMNISGVQQLGDFVFLLGAPKVLIDHHLDPDKFELTFSCTRRSSTSELVFLIMEALRPQGKPSKQIAERIMMGIITDTGGFAYNSSQPDTFRVVARLLEAGVNKDDIIDRVMNNAPESRLRLLGLILKDKMIVIPECGAAYFSLSVKEMRAFELERGATEGFVNYPLSIKGIVFTAFLREDRITGEIRISLRSKGDFSVNDFAAQYFNGGGHKNAAGGSYWGSMGEAENILVKGIREHAAELLKVSQASIH